MKRAIETKPERAKINNSGKRKADLSGIEPKRINFYNSEKMQQVYVYLSRETLLELSSAEKAVYIVLCCKSHGETNQWTPLSQAMVAQFAGLSRVIVNKVFQSLKEKTLLKYRTRNVNGSHVQCYKVEYYQGDEIQSGIDDRDLFQFYKSIVLNGTWSRLTPEAKVLYLAMRELASCDIELYFEIEHQEFVDSTERREFAVVDYNRRKWDFLPLDRFNDFIFSLVWMNTPRIKAALKVLTTKKLIIWDPDQTGGFKVYLKPEYNKELEINA